LFLKNEWMINAVFQLISLILFFLFNVSSLYACAPCNESFGLTQTILHADTIVVGQKVKDGPSSVRGEALGGPDWTEVRVLEVIKGTAGEGHIFVNSWNGPCLNGIILDDKTYLLFLIHKPSSEDISEYDAVNGGCAVRTLLVDDEDVNVQGTPRPLEEMIKMINGAESQK
jgi:hypothetical protein